MFSQTNDLQKAIDQVTNNIGGNDANKGGAQSSADKDVTKIQDQLGVPPVPPMSGNGVPPMPAPFSDVKPEAEPVKVNKPPMAAPGAEKPSEPAAGQAEPVNVTVVEPAKTAETINIAAAVPEVGPMPGAEANLATGVENTSVANDGNKIAEDGEISKIRENVLKDLMPLMDKVQGGPEEKFEIYKDAMDTLHDKALVSGAYKVASQITDENKKAESLIELMKAIDTLK